MERIKHDEYKYKVVSLFAGIGGFDIAFQNAGFDIIWANDFDKYCVQTYKANVGDRIVLGDIGKLKGFDDERGTLFFTIKEILKKNKTKVVVLENVKNIMNHDNGKTFKRIISELEEIGYNVFYKVLNSADFGVPQRRNRVLIVAFNNKYLKKKNFTYPDGYELKVTTQDLLDKDVDDRYFISTNMIGTILGKGTKGYIVKPTIDQEVCKCIEQAKITILQILKTMKNIVINQKQI